MRIIGHLLTAIGFLTVANATEDGLVLVPQPLSVEHGEIAIVDVPFVIGKAVPESIFQAIAMPYVPPSVSYRKQQDINLASLAGIKIRAIHQTGREYRIKLDYGEVQESDQTDELLSAVLDCVYRVAGQESGYTIEVTITNLAAESKLHVTLDRLIENKDKVENEQPATAVESKGQ